jgi:hypothetical protein
MNVRNVLTVEVSQLTSSDHNVVSPNRSGPESRLRSPPKMPGVRPSHKNKNEESTYSEKRREKTPSSNYRGVSYSKHDRKYMAQIDYGGKLNFLGLYKYEADAALAYDKGRQVLFGKFDPPEHNFCTLPTYEKAIRMDAANDDHSIEVKESYDAVVEKVEIYLSKIYADNDNATDAGVSNVEGIMDSDGDRDRSASTCIAMYNSFTGNGVSEVASNNIPMHATSELRKELSGDINKEYTRVRKAKTKRSEFIGVYYNKNSKLFFALLIRGQRRHHLGLWKLQADAALAYDRASKLLMGTDCDRLNFASRRDYTIHRVKELDTLEVGLGKVEVESVPSVEARIRTYLSKFPCPEIDALNERMANKWCSRLPQETGKEFLDLYQRSIDKFFTNLREDDNTSTTLPDNSSNIGEDWGPPPHTPRNPRHQQPHHYDNHLSSHHHYQGHHYPNDDGPPPAYHGTPGRHGSFADGGVGNIDYASDSRSYDSTLSKKSFRSLDDLEEPMQSLLYRPSFSWERGLDVPAGGGNPPPSTAAPFPPPSYSRADVGGTDVVPLQLCQQQKIMKPLPMRSEIRTIGNPSGPVGLILLLAMPQDRHCLSETLCIVRNNVEVFTATENDINAPAPGRKRPIQVGQVGLRCVYCRMCHQRDRVKRAMCFPSSIKRIYRSVIDMKLDHFKNCPYVPAGLKARLDHLQAGSTRSTGMTVQYFVKSARELGMCDSTEDGVFIDLKWVGSPPPLHGMRLVGDVAGGSANNTMGPSNAHQYSGHEYRQSTRPDRKKMSPPHLAPQGATSHDDACMIAPPQGGDSMRTSSSPKIPENRFAGSRCRRMRTS